MNVLGRGSAQVLEMQRPRLAESDPGGAALLQRRALANIGQLVGEGSFEYAEGFGFIEKDAGYLAAAHCQDGNRPRRRSGSIWWSGAFSLRLENLSQLAAAVFEADFNITPIQLITAVIGLR